jgi:hypothetical protein
MLSRSVGRPRVPCIPPDPLLELTARDHELRKPAISGIAFWESFDPRLNLDEMAPTPLREAPSRMGPTL